MILLNVHLHITVATGKEGDLIVLIQPALLCLLASFGSQPNEGPQICTVWVSLAAFAGPAACSSEPPAWQPLTATGHERTPACINGGFLLCVDLYFRLKLA
jgi:hypothetical protein